MRINKLTPTTKRAISLRSGLCWDLPMLATAVGALVFHDMPTIQTACVDAKGNTWINPDFFAAQPDKHARFVLLHEACHPMLLHQNRRGDRDPKLWNIAADLSINAALEHVHPSVEVPEYALLPRRNAPGAPEFASAEQYYAFLTNNAEARAKCGAPDKGRGQPGDQEPGDGDGDGEGGPKPGAGCGVREGKGQGGGGDAAEDGPPSGGGLTPAQWRSIAHHVQERIAEAHRAGNAALGALANLFSIPPPRVKWAAILRRAATLAQTAAGRDDVSWQRRSRRSCAAYSLPGQVTTKARIAVVIDASGSVSDKALARAVSETCAAVDASGVPAYLVVHDAVVQYAAWIRPGVRGRQVAEAIRGRGGTLFTPAYEAVGELRERFGSLVHFTDGIPCEPWPELPSNCRHGFAALIGAAVDSLVPDRWDSMPCDI